MTEAGERSVPYFCPYCGGEDLHPSAVANPAWECRECTRVFIVTFVGMLNRGLGSE